MSTHGHLNMCNTLELSVLFICLGDWLSFLVATGGDKKLLDCTLLGEISTQTNTMDIGAQKCSRIL